MGKPNNHQHMSMMQQAQMSQEKDRVVVIRKVFLKAFAGLCAVNLINCLAYNTGLVSFTLNEWDVGWSMLMFCLNFIPMMLIGLTLSKE